MTGFTVPLPGGGIITSETRGGHGGHGVPVVFLHGFGGSGAGWDAVWRHLPGAMALLRYDLRGFGASLPAPAAPFSHSDDLRALMDARGIAQADLVGLSMGGAIAVHFALEHPARVRRLVLVSPALTGWEWSQPWRTHWRASTSMARAGDMAGARAAWLAHPLFDSTRSGPAAGALAAEIAHFAGAQWLADPQAPEMPDVDRLHALTAPVLLCAGAQDLTDFRLIADLLAGAAPDMTRRDFTGGHMLHLEQAEELASAIAGFLA